MGRRDEEGGVPVPGRELGPVSRGSEDFPVVPTVRVSRGSEKEEGMGKGVGVSGMAIDPVFAASVEEGGPRDSEDKPAPVSMGPAGMEGDNEGDKETMRGTDIEVSPVSVALGSVPVAGSVGLSLGFGKGSTEGSGRILVVSSTVV